MAVGSSVSEIVDRSTTRLVARCRPCLQLGSHLESPFVESNLGIGLLVVDAGRNLALLHGQDCFDQTRQSGSRLRMADVAFHRSNTQWFCPVGMRPKYGCDGARFNRITRGRTRAVGFEILSTIWAEACPSVAFTHKLNLRWLRR